MSIYQQYAALESDDNTEHSLTFRDQKEYQAWLAKKNNG